jgi:ubiquinol-cytochrome c reductase cytochrome c subunit
MRIYFKPAWLLAVGLAGLSFAPAHAQNNAAPGNAASGAATNAASGNVEHGRQLMTAIGCYECHGYVGQGSIRTGPALAPNVIPLSAFAAQLRKPADHMPPYTAAVVSDSDIADIHAYLTSLPKPPKLADVPMLQQ